MPAFYKSELRKKFTKKRNAFSLLKIQELSKKISQNFSTEEQLLIYEYYHIFLPIVDKKEIDTQFLQKVLQHKKIIIPKSDFKNFSLKHFLLEKNTQIEKNKWNIPEPVNAKPISEKLLQVVFLPLLCFDKRGYRVGYGKGFYDRFLQKCNKNTIKIGVSLFDPVDEIIDIHLNDVKMDFAITPNKIFSFSEK